MVHIRILGFLVVVSLVMSLAACGGAGSFGGKRCVDYQGFPVDCDTPGAIVVKPVAAAPMVSWKDSAGGSEVEAAFGDLVSFTADAEHALVADGVASPTVRALSDGSVLQDGVRVGFVAYVVRPDGTTGTALVSAEGRLFEVTLELDGPGLVPASEPATLLPLGTVGVPSEAAVSAGVPVATMG